MGQRFIGIEVFSPFLRESGLSTEILIRGFFVGINRTSFMKKV